MMPVSYTHLDVYKRQAYSYGEKNREKLYKEFVTRLKQKDYQDWLYGTCLLYTSRCV